MCYIPNITIAYTCNPFYFIMHRVINIITAFRIVSMSKNAHVFTNCKVMKNPRWSTIF